MRWVWAAGAGMVLAGCMGSSDLGDGAPYPKNIAARDLPGSTYDFIQKGGGDEVVTSFVFWGCNGLDQANVDTSGFASTANQPWLAQHMADTLALQAIDPTLPSVPPYLFVTGDLVLNQKNDESASLNSQLRSWANFFRSQPLAKAEQTLPVLMLGDHESLYKKTDGTDKGFTYLPKSDGNLQAWSRLLRERGFFAPSPNPREGVQTSSAGVDDGVASPTEAFMSYSFDVGDLHFVVLNTDTFNDQSGANGQKAIGWIQLKWLQRDLAEASKRSDLIFVFGHKPAVAFASGVAAPQDGSVQINSALRQQFIDTLNGNPKVAGYFCAHAHAWSAQSLVSSGLSKKTLQIISGNGGSPLDNWTGDYFGFTLVKITRGGKVTATSYGRPTPSPITEKPSTPLVAVTEVTVFPR